ncbi:hypothetical protein CRG98_011977 [Punica granatum]|uniref:BAH domain-containing protein n=1 Tax=Punica granatum TaxID=22663 RepID=A0A2I0KGZ8_PUNGR|nr:hypothetical protein CRG98_011977 [Punica granatum]
MWEDQVTGLKWVKANRCYFPSDLPDNVGRPFTETNEVFESNREVTFVAGTIRGPCEVLHPTKYKEETERRSHEGNVGLTPVFLCKPSPVKVCLIILQVLTICFLGSSCMVNPLSVSRSSPTLLSTLCLNIGRNSSKASTESSPTSSSSLLSLNNRRNPKTPARPQRRPRHPQPAERRPPPSSPTVSVGAAEPAPCLVSSHLVLSLVPSSSLLIIFCLNPTISSEMESIRVDIVNTEDKGASMVMIDGVQGDRHLTKISLREYDKNDNVGELVEAHGITHPNLIRSYVFNLQARTVLCEPNVIPLSQWVKHNHRMLNTSLQRPYHGAVLYICDDVKRIIRGLLHLLIYIHEEKRLYARKFTMDNVVVVEGEAKFANLQLYKLAGSSTLQERAKTNDFDCLGKILGQMFGKRSLPRDMTKFIAALGDPQISLLRFLRNVVTHLPEQLVQKNVQFVSDDISLAILNHYPDFVVDVQRKLHDRDDSLLGKL